jgi:hypothetical protein
VGSIPHLWRRFRVPVTISAMGHVRPRELTALSLRVPLLDAGRRVLALIYSLGMPTLSLKGVYAILVTATLVWGNGWSSPGRGELEMRVELQVYSVRRNPSWDLSAQDVAELARRMADLPRSQHPFVEGGLGYGGFVIHNPENTAGLPTMIKVFSGIGIPEAGGVAVYEDAHDIEGWLLQQARQHGYGAILSEVSKNGAR